jgi:adenylate kinase family enzyme
MITSMKIMIFGDVASGKSTVSDKLGGKLGLPVLHLDEVMAKLGREQKAHIRDFIKDEADKPDWIIEGNAFTKDPSYRIEKADVVIVFAMSRLATFMRHARRTMRVRMGLETKAGGVTGDLRLGYYVPYIFWKFPARRQKAHQKALELGKQVLVVHNFKQAAQLLERQFESRSV